ncbi:MAG: DUF192 domain-containing protein [Candidatus Colwellbacteria bacterium]|nr:DUF192 domain-containing protein [Candidatus Colwellbacteria bacterium]
MKVFLTSALVLGLFIAIIAAGFLVYGSGVISKEKRGKVIIRDTEFNVVVAHNPMARSRGLSGRESLAENEGMLFLFPNTGYQVFWMKGMVIPIDIIWIKENRIVGFEVSVQPEPGVKSSRLTRYAPPEAVSRVLEVPAGTVGRLGIQVGDEIIVNYN